MASAEDEAPTPRKGHFSKSLPKVVKTFPKGPSGSRLDYLGIVCRLLVIFYVIFEKFAKRLSKTLAWIIWRLFANFGLFLMSFFEKSAKSCQTRIAWITWQLFANFGVVVSKNVPLMFF